MDVICACSDDAHADTLLLWLPAMILRHTDVPADRKVARRQHQALTQKRLDAAEAADWEVLLEDLTQYLAKGAPPKAEPCRQRHCQCKNTSGATRP